MRVSDDPVVRARGYLWAANGNLFLAAYLLPDDHPEKKKLAKLKRQVEEMHDKLVSE